MIYKSKHVTAVISFFISNFLLILLWRFLNITGTFQELTFCLASAALAFLIYRSIKGFSKDFLIPNSIFSLILSLTFIIGRKIDIWNAPHFASFHLTDIVYLITLGIIFFVILLNITEFVLKTSFSDLKIKKKNIRIWVIAFCVMIAAWMPYLLLYYPGNVSRDSWNSILQGIGENPFLNHHPVLFTLFVSPFVRFGKEYFSLNFGVALFSFAQMLIMASVLSYFVYWIYKKGLKRYVVVASTLFFALNPIIAVYTVTMWKDVLFSAWVLLLILLLYDIIESKGEKLRSPKTIAALAAVSLIIPFSRNNGLFIIAPVLVVLVLCMRKYFKILLPVTVSVILTVSLIQGPLYDHLGIKSGGFEESAGIPLQQIGYAVNQGGEISKEDREFLNRMLPLEDMAESYMPYSPDSIKFHPNFNKEFLNENKLEFIKTWFRLLPANFSSYVKAWLMQTVGYYYMGIYYTPTYLGVYDDGSNMLHNIDFIEQIFKVDLKVNRPEALFDLPGISLLINIGFMVWLLFFICLIIIRQKRFIYIVPLVPLLILWAIMIAAAPVHCEFRYMFPFHLALPFMVITLFIRNKEQKQHKITQ